MLTIVLKGVTLPKYSGPTSTSSLIVKMYSGRSRFLVRVVP